MASWGTRRRNIIIFLFILIVSLLTVAVGYFFYYEEPTCFDGQKNGLEDGIDCGGNCVLLCTNQVTEPIIHWKRFFQIGPNTYNVIAYVENQNPTAGASNVEYIFKLYDENNVSLVERRGYVNIKPNQVTPVIENNINTGKLNATRVAFDFVGEIKWFKQQPIGKLVVIKDQDLVNSDGLPRVTANVLNNTLGLLENIKFIVLVYDENSNVVGTSNTIIYRLERDQSQRIIFTWPIPFGKEASRFEIIPIYDLGN